jgi:hypothetical protein
VCQIHVRTFPIPETRCTKLSSEHSTTCSLNEYDTQENVPRVSGTVELMLDDAEVLDDNTLEQS